MYRLLPFLFMLAVIPDSEKKLENLSSFIGATKDSVSSIKNGLNSFHSNIIPFMMAQAQSGEKTGGTGGSSSPGAGQSGNQG